MLFNNEHGLRVLLLNSYDWSIIAIYMCVKYEQYNSIYIWYFLKDDWIEVLSGNVTRYNVADGKGKPSKKEISQNARDQKGL